MTTLEKYSLCLVLDLSNPVHCDKLLLTVTILPLFYFWEFPIFCLSSVTVSCIHRTLFLYGGKIQELSIVGLHVIGQTRLLQSSKQAARPPGREGPLSRADLFILGRSFFETMLHFLPVFPLRSFKFKL